MVRSLSRGKRIILLSLFVIGAAISPVACYASGGDDNSGGGSGGESDDNDVAVRGAITAIDSSSLTVGGVQYAIDVNTELKIEGNEHAAVTDFQVGDFVKIEAATLNNLPYAKEVEKEDSHDDGDANDDHSGGGAKVTCDLTTVNLVEGQVARAVKAEIRSRGFTNVKVRVKARRVGAARKLGSPHAALGGLRISKANDASGLKFDLSGSLDNLQECEADFDFRVSSQGKDDATHKIKSAKSTSRLAVSGVLAR